MSLSEDRLLATKNVCRLVQYGILANLAEMLPIIMCMLRLSEHDVQESGARLASIAALIHENSSSGSSIRPADGTLCVVNSAFLRQVYMPDTELEKLAAQTVREEAELREIEAARATATQRLEALSAKLVRLQQWVPCAPISPQTNARRSPSSGLYSGGEPTFSPGTGKTRKSKPGATPRRAPTNGCVGSVKNHASNVASVPIRPSSL